MTEWTSPGRAQPLRLFEQASKLAGWGAWECDLATEELSWTDAVYGLFGLPVGARLKRSDAVGHYVDESRQAMETLRAEAVRTGRGFVLDACIRPDRQRTRWIRLTAGVASDQGRAVRLYGAKQDITREKEAWISLRRHAENDPLTGLANRRTFDERLVDVVRREPPGSVLILVDLDRFKAINDGHGHAAGDAVLRESALRLRRHFPGETVVARIGGDEFAILLHPRMARAPLRDLLARASLDLAQPVHWNGALVDISASIGARILGEPPGRPTALFVEADTALYAAKLAGRNTVRLYGVDVASSESLSQRSEGLPLPQFGRMPAHAVAEPA